MGRPQLELYVKSLKHREAQARAGKETAEEIEKKSAFKESLGLGATLGITFPRRPTTCTGFHSGSGYRSSQPQEPSYKINPTEMKRFLLPGMSNSTVSQGGYSPHDALLKRSHQWPPVLSHRSNAEPSNQEMDSFKTMNPFV